jgi:hypothetical protein
MAGRLTDRLDTHFGSGTVFMDVESISPGRDFARVIEEAVGSCEVVLVIIGSRWLTVADGDGRRRLDLPADIVALEVATGLARGIPVVPVLVDGAAPLAESELPERLAALARLQALRVDHESFPADVAALITMLERLSLGLTRQADHRRQEQRPRIAFAAFLIAGLVAVLAAGAILLAPSGAADGPIMGKVVNTFSVTEGRPIGVSKFPSAQTNAGRQNGPAEGAAIALSCKTSGRSVTDHVLNQSSDQWFLAEIDGGRWFVSALYIDVLAGRVVPRCPP